MKSRSSPRTVRFGVLAALLAQLLPGGLAIADPPSGAAQGTGSAGSTANEVASDLTEPRVPRPSSAVPPGPKAVDLSQMGSPSADDPRAPSQLIPPAHVTQLEKQAQELLELGRCPAARELVSQALSNSFHPRLLFWKAESYRLCATNAEAREAYQAVLSWPAPVFSPAELAVAKNWIVALSTPRGRPRPRLYRAGAVLTGIGGTLFGVGLILTIVGAAGQGHDDKYGILSGISVGSAGIAGFLAPGIPLLIVGNRRPGSSYTPPL
jgi:hypothetical protein